MNELFIKLLNISITASWLSLAVILIRLTFRKIPRWIYVILWVLVGIRLICPISIESALSLIPSRETVPEEIIYSATPEIHSGIAYLNSAVNPVLSESLAPTPEAGKSPIEALTNVASVIWISGVILMLLYSVVSYLVIKYRVREAAKVQDNILECDRISTPFILGILNPKIYVPSTLCEADLQFVIAHERAHIKRLDHIWKPVGFLLLTLYWFNPILWISYVLLCRDIEVACDEKVLRSMGDEVKADYSNALINCSIPRKMISACPLAFGEVGVKARVRNVLNYKKPAFWIVTVGIVICVAAAVFFLTDPLSDHDELDAGIEDFIVSELSTPEAERGEAFCAVDLNVLDVVRKDSKTTVYAWVFTKAYNSAGESLSGSHIPTVITVTEAGGELKLTDYRMPEDGNMYEDSIKDMFPVRLWRHALDNSSAAEQEAECDRLAAEYFGVHDTSPMEIYELSCGSELSDVRLRIKASSVSNDNPYVIVEWVNDSDDEITFGSVFDLYFSEDGEWKDAATEDHLFNLLAYSLDAGEVREHTYFLDGFDLSKDRPCIYRLETTCRREAEGDDTKYKVWIYFDIPNVSTSYDLSDTATEMFQANSIAYTYEGGPEKVFSPVLTLSTDNNSCTFTYSLFSSYAGIGTYEETNSRLCVRTNDGENVWYFDKAGNTLVFDGESSSPIPSYKYSSDSVPECPVPDGAVFERYKSVEASPYFAGVECDIDGDGTAEMCNVGLGTLSGNFSIRVTVHEGDMVEYSEQFIVEHGSITLSTASGKVILNVSAPTDEGSPDTGKFIRYMVSVVNGKLTLSQIDQTERGVLGQ